MKRMAVAIGLAAAMSLTAATVFAWGPGMGRGYGPGCGAGYGPGYGVGYGPGYGAGYGPGCAAAAVPNVSAEQAAKIRKIQDDRYAEAVKIRGEMIARRLELQALYREPVLDQAKIAAKQKEIAALQARNQEKAMAARTACAEVLTPEQRAQLPAYGRGFGGGRGRGMGFGGRW